MHALSEVLDVGATLEWSDARHDLVTFLSR